MFTFQISETTLKVWNEVHFYGAFVGLSRSNASDPMTLIFNPNPVSSEKVTIKIFLTALQVESVYHGTCKWWISSSDSSVAPFYLHDLFCQCDEHSRPTASSRSICREHVESNFNLNQFQTPGKLRWKSCLIQVLFVYEIRCVVYTWLSAPNASKKNLVLATNWQANAKTLGCKFENDPLSAAGLGMSKFTTNDTFGMSSLQKEHS